MHVGQVLQQKALKFPDKPAIISREMTYSYADLLNRATCLANGLLERGLSKGDRAGVLGRKTPETIIAYLGMGLAGIVGVPISFHNRRERLEQIVQATDLKLLFVDQQFLPLVQGISGLPRKVVIITIGKEKTGAGDMSWQEFMVDSGTVSPNIELQDDDIFYLNFTSGSTGQPKAVATSHSHIHWNTLSSIEALDIENQARHLCTFAVFSHPHEIFARPLWTGGTMVLVDSLYPKSIASMINDYGVSCVMGLAPMYEMLLPFAQSERFDFSSLRLAESGGMATNLELQRKFLDSFGLAIRPVWGSTETTGVALATQSMTGLTRSCGKGAPYYTIKIIGPDGSEVSRGETGEMIVQGPAVVSGYQGDDQETEKYFRDGWFHTADMVYQDDDEYFYLRGRETGMMKVGGLKVFPQEIEETIMDLPEIEEVAVIPVFEKLRGEVPLALVVLKEGESENPQKIKEFCRNSLPNYMVPKKVEFRPSLPRTASGKIDKRAILLHFEGHDSLSFEEELCQRIERTDLKILHLLNERTKLSLALREFMKKEKRTLFSPNEEEEIINKILGFNNGPLHDQYVERFFREFLDYLITL